jgi:hypothetical protein
MGVRALGRGCSSSKQQVWWSDLPACQSMKLSPMLRGMQERSVACLTHSGLQPTAIRQRSAGKTLTPCDAVPLVDVRPVVHQRLRHFSGPDPAAAPDASRFPKRAATSYA